VNDSSAVDPDDIAYIGDEDDTRGPGCLAVLAGVAGGLAIVGFLGSFIWLIANDILTGGLKAAFAGGVQVYYIAVVMFVTLLAGGFAIGLGLYSASQARLSERPHIALWGTIAAILGGLAVLGTVGEILLMIPWFR